MPSNFDFLSDQWAEAFDYAEKTERYATVDPAVAAFCARRTLEQIVNWMYVDDESLQWPRKDGVINSQLGFLIRDPTFEHMLDPELLPHIKRIHRLGNEVAHDNPQINAARGLKITRSLHLFASWFARHYGQPKPQTTAFDDTLIPGPSDTAPAGQDQVQKLQEQLGQKDTADTPALSSPVVPSSQPAAPLQSRNEARMMSAQAPPTRWLRVVDLFLALALFAVPAVLGGRTGWGQLVLVLAASGAAIAWIAGRVCGRLPGYRWTWAEPVLAAGVGLLTLQVVPLPASLTTILSPRLAQWLPAWTTAGLGSWSTLSLVPTATVSAAISVAAVALLFAVACQRIRTIEDVETTLKAIGIAAALMAAFGLVQYVTSNGRFFWFYDHPFTSTAYRVKGAFTNKNHFAQFLALGLAPLAWWLFRLVGRRPATKRDFGTLAQRAGTGDMGSGLLMIGLGLVIFAGLLALSRGGAFALGISGLTCCFVLYLHRQISGRLVAGLVTTSLLVASCLAIYGFRDVSQRLEEWDLGVRLMIWDANLQAAADFPWTGTGAGTHAETYRGYLSEPYQQREFTHAENSPLQLASETGLPGLLLAVLAIGGCLAWCRQSLGRAAPSRITVAGAAVFASLIAHLVHSFVDFLWYVPGCMVVVALLAACARALAAATNPVSETPTAPTWGSRLGWIVAAVLCLSATGWSLDTCGQRIAGEPHWNDYLRIRFAKNQASDDVSQTAAARRQKNRRLHRARLLALGRTITADPNHARGHLRLASHYVALVEELRTSGANPGMPLSQIRQAALTAGFQSAAERDEWLDRPGVLGSHRKHLEKALAHARRGLALSPLQGMGYVYVAQLGYLEGHDADSSRSLLQQAIVVRPHEARIHEAAGIEASLAGDQQKWLHHWKQAFHLDRAVQQRILKRLADTGLPPQVIIREFHPDWEALAYMKDLYRQTLPAEEYTVVLAGYAEAAENRAGKQDGTDAVTSWLQAAGAYRQLDRTREAQACYEEALGENPSSLTARLAFGRWLFAQKRFTEASDHLEWCLRQQPDDDKLKRLARQCRRAAAGR